MTKLIFLLSFFVFTFAQGSLLISYEEFVKLPDNKKHFYIVELRKALVEIGKATNSQDSQTFLKYDFLYQSFLSPAWAEQENCWIAGHPGKKKDGKCLPKSHFSCTDKNEVECPSEKYELKGRPFCAPSIKDCPQIALKKMAEEGCLNAGYLFIKDSDRCGEKDKTIKDCKLERVGARNIYPCPRSIYGYDFDGNVKCVPSAADCVNPVTYNTKLKCFSKGYLKNNPLATETCGDSANTPGVKSDKSVVFDCPADIVGSENKYPCLPLQVFGWDTKNRALCTNVNPSTSLTGYYKSCADKSTLLKYTSASAALTMMQNPANFRSLAEQITRTCTIEKVQQCKKALALLEDAKSYVSTSSSEAPVKQRFHEKVETKK